MSLSSAVATGTLRDASSTCTTDPEYLGAILIAVCAALVVAPPISSGVFIPNRSISDATCIISSRLGVISPDNPMMSAPTSRAFARIFSHDTITPMSMISKLLQASTMPTMFFPMSCTSPFTVASTIVRPFADTTGTSADSPLPSASRPSAPRPTTGTSPLAARSAAILFASSFSAFMNGSSHATLFFITRALFTTCGRNIFPSPNRSPTTLIPSISGPSITFSGTPYFSRASSVSSSMKSVRPFSSACFSRSSTGPSRHDKSASTFFPACPLNRSA